MKKTIASLFLLISTIIVLAACGAQGVKPVAVDEKNDKCATCNMAVTNNQYATEVILNNGKALKFDDIGCMYKWMKDNPNEKLQAKFVRDYNSKEWIPSENAMYVYEKSIKTPMAYNVISFKTKADAETYVKNNKGTVLTYQDLNNHSWDMNQDMIKNKKEMMNHSH